MCRSGSKAIPCGGFARVESSPRITKEFFSVDPEDQTQLVVVRVAALTFQPIRNRKEEHFGFPLASNRDAGLRENHSARAIRVRPGAVSLEAPDWS